MGNDFATPYDAIKHMGAMQAQDIGQATRATGSRLNNGNKNIIKKSLSNGSIVRTWPMRGTLHYLAPENVHRMLDLCASKTLTGFAKRRDFLGITDQYSEKALEIIEKELRGGKTLTRTQLGNVLISGGIPMQTQRVYHLACYAATRKLICFGPPTEKEETFVLLDEWIPNKLNLTRDEQLAELARMYIRGHGPVTVDDLAWWCGLGKGDCKKAFALVANECESLEYNGKSYVYLPSLSKGSEAEGAIKTSVPLEGRGGWGGIKLLAGFDEYFLGYKDRSIVADIQDYGKLFTSNGIFFPLIMIDGKIVGIWKRAWKKDRVEISLSPLPGVILPMTEVQAEAERYATFWGIEKAIIL